MTSEKFIAFMEKLLEKTKNKEIIWYRLKIHHSLGLQDKCFYCHANNMEITLITPAKNSESISLHITYDSEIPGAELQPRNQNEEVVLLRLFNYVYSLFPNLESSIDKFLNDF